MYPDFYGMNILLMKNLYAQDDFNDEEFMDYVDDVVMNRNTEKTEYLTDAFKTHEITGGWTGGLPIIDYE